jgi:integrase
VALDPGILPLHPHQLRHAFASGSSAEGGNENELMLVAGWKSRIMVARYTRATAAERARARHAYLSPADRLQVSPHCPGWEWLGGVSARQFGVAAAASGLM